MRYTPIPETPKLLKTDSYKTGHPFMYHPDVNYSSCYLTARGPLFEDDQRIVACGAQSFCRDVLAHPITHHDIDEALDWIQYHGPGKTAYPFPDVLLRKVVREHEGYWPIEIDALPDGTVVYPQVPLFQATMRGEYAPLMTFLEPQWTQHIWSATTTATKSRHCYDYLQAAFVTSVDPENYWMLVYRLHDFSLRGASSDKTAMFSGYGHLLAGFEGTDNMPAGWLASLYNGFYKNKLWELAVGESVWATEHAIMTQFPTELDAAIRASQSAPIGAILSVVADSYDYENFLNIVVPALKPYLEARKQILVVRPDSGEPIKCVLMALEALGKTFGFHVNGKGYKCLKNCAVIQGDGINIHSLKLIVDAVLAAGWSMQNVLFGMGGGLVQDQTRDTLKIATKLNYLQLLDGTAINCMKQPKTDLGKFSCPGELAVYGKQIGLQGFHDPSTIKVVPKGSPRSSDDSLLLTCLVEEPFSKSRERLTAEWPLAPKTLDPISAELKAKIEANRR